MSYEPYSLEIVSQHHDFKNKKLKKYNIDGVDTIGAYGDEPFEVVFKNNTYNTVQVKISIDGTDILTGGLADTLNSGKMWLVKPYSSLVLKAWPETTKRGAQFIFTSSDKSVAVNTHGNTSSQGIIAAAVYVEESTFTLTSKPYWHDWYGTGNPWYGKLGDSYCDYSWSTNSTLSGEASLNNLRKFAGVGAGSHVEQQINHVPGLLNPQLNSTLKVKFVWWDQLVEACRSRGIVAESGFPGDEQRLMSIGRTPRKDSWSPLPFNFDYKRVY